MIINSLHNVAAEQASGSFHASKCTNISLEVFPTKRIIITFIYWHIWQCFFVICLFIMRIIIINSTSYEWLPNSTNNLNFLVKMKTTKTNRPVLANILHKHYCLYVYTKINWIYFECTTSISSSCVVLFKFIFFNYASVSLKLYLFSSFNNNNNKNNINN